MGLCACGIFICLFRFFLLSRLIVPPLAPWSRVQLSPILFSIHFSIHLSPTLWNFVQHFDFIEIASVAIISKISNIYFGVCVFAFDFPTLITLLPIVLCMSNSSIFTGSSHTVAGLGLRSLPYEFVNQSHGWACTKYMTFITRAYLMKAILIIIIEMVIKPKQQQQPQKKWKKETFEVGYMVNNDIVRTPINVDMELSFIQLHGANGLYLLVWFDERERVFCSIWTMANPRSSMWNMS